MLKQGVSILGVRAETVLAIYIVARNYDKLGEEFTLTSVRDGTHMEGSYHYEGLAFDARLPRCGRIEKLVAMCRADLGDSFDVVVEETHLHIEYDERRAKHGGHGSRDAESET